MDGLEKGLLRCQPQLTGPVQSPAARSLDLMTGELNKQRVKLPVAEDGR